MSTSQGSEKARLSRAELIERVNARRGREASSAEPKPRSPDAKPVCSPLQERLWFLQQLDPDLVAYNRHAAVRLDGPVDAELLARAINLVMQRHETLRSRFTPRAGSVELDFRSSSEVALVVEELAGGEDAGDSAQRIRDRIRDLVQVPFDLAGDVLLRAFLFRISKSDSVLAVIVHHIVSDGWSDGVVFAEIAQIYTALDKGRVPTLPALPFQFADYAALLRTQLETGELDQHLAFWKRRLAGAPESLNLVTDMPRPARPRHQGGRVDLGELTALVGQAEAVARAEAVTLHQALAAAWSVLLSRYAAGADVVLGTPVAGRSRPSLWGLVGCFVNTVVIRSELAGDPSFRAVMASTSKSMSEALDHQDVPFDRLVATTVKTRDPSRTPIFQVFFGLHDTPTRVTGFSGIEVSRFPVYGETAIFDLNLSILKTERGYTGAIEFNRDLFRRETIEAMGEHLRTLLREVFANPSLRISELNLWTEAQRARYVTLRNETQVAAQPGTPIAAIYETGRRVPDRSAVVCGSARLSYAKLLERAGHVATMLSASGVRTGEAVAVLLPRDERLVVAMLGTMLVGAVYVPLDGSHPRARLEYIVENAGVRAIVSTASCHALLPRSPAPIFEVDAPSSGWHGTPSEISPSAPCYLMYTSGSTGVPKGVVVSHDALLNFLHAMRTRPGMCEDDVLLAVTTPTFDIAYLELLLPLLVGGCVAVADAHEVKDPQLLAGAIERHRATIMQATPATWQLLIDGGFAGAMHLKALCGGEAMTTQLAQQLLARVGSLWNMYGPTETTVWSMVGAIASLDDAKHLGGPIDNTQVYVVDAHGSLAPIGAPGELVIAGRGLASGYHERPELTARQFVSFERGPLAGTRVYRTGDCARYRADGTIEFLGRLDFQVKVRGHRIELGEIEAGLASQDHVLEAVVTLDGTGRDARLLGYVRARPGADVDLTAVRKRLGERLPAYMVPSFLMVVEQWPLTGSGKIDRKQLPKPAVQEPTATRAMTPLEQRLASTWGELLGVAPSAPQLSFFDAGGHSLLAVELISRIQTTFGTALPMRALFEHPTLEAMAQLIAQPPETTSESVPLARMRADCDAELNLGEVPPPGEHAKRATLLTGVTGLVGATVLPELLAAGTGPVYCLVRASDAASARARIEEAVTKYCGPTQLDWTRLVPVLGDIAQPRLALSDSEWAQLSARLGRIFHLAARVNFVESYATLRAANVEGVRTLVNLAAESGAFLHHVSTLYVCDAHAQDFGITERSVLDAPQRLSIGYTQSKWVGEQIVERATRQGVRAATYRLGRISGGTRTGASQDDGFLWRMLRTCILMGSVPQIGSGFGLLPADVAARALVALAQGDADSCATYHVASHHVCTIGRLAERLRARGYVIEELPYDVWRERLTGSPSLQRDPSSSLLSRLLPADLSAQRMLGEVERFSTENTLRALASRGVDVREVPETVLDRYIAHFIDTQLFPLPEAVHSRSV